ncbi:hypothetical protein ACNKHS_11370 [Shigella flexneri]
MPNMWCSSGTESGTITRFTHDSRRLHQVLVLTGVNGAQYVVRMQVFVTVFAQAMSVAV